MGWGGSTRKRGWSAWRRPSWGVGGAVRHRSCSVWRCRSHFDLLDAVFFFLVDYGCGSVGFDLDRIVFFLGSLVGFNDLAANWVGDDLAWLGFRLGGWWMSLGLNEFRIEWVGFLDDVGWVVMMVAGWWWWLGVEWLLVVMDCGSVRERGSEGGNNKKL